MSSQPNGYTQEVLDTSTCNKPIIVTKMDVRKIYIYLVFGTYFHLICFQIIGQGNQCQTPGFKFESQSKSLNIIQIRKKRNLNNNKGEPQQILGEKNRNSWKKQSSIGRNRKKQEEMGRIRKKQEQKEKKHKVTQRKQEETKRNKKKKEKNKKKQKETKRNKKKQDKTRKKDTTIKKKKKKKNLKKLEETKTRKNM